MTIDQPPNKLLDPARDTLRCKHSSRNAEDACVDWMPYTNE